MSHLQHINSSISDNPEPPKKKDVKKENTFLNLGFNLILPILLLNKGKQWFGSYLEPYFENVAVGVLPMMVDTCTRVHSAEIEFERDLVVRLRDTVTTAQSLLL